MLALSIFGLALGEELWLAYIPALLTAFGASGVVVGLFGSAKDLLDSVYQYPGGRLADRLGRRRALMLFTALATTGYAIYALARSWPPMFAGLACVMAWKAGAFPTTFAVIGDSLPRERRATAFSVQKLVGILPLARLVSAPAAACLFCLVIWLVAIEFVGEVMGGALALVAYASVALSRSPDLVDVALGWLRR